MVVFYLLIFCIDLYLFQGIKTLTAGFQSETNRSIVHWLFWMVHLALALTILYGYMAYDRERGMKTAQIVAFNAVILLMIPKLVFLFVLFGQDVVRLFGTGANYALGHQNTEGDDLQ